MNLADHSFFSFFEPEMAAVMADGAVLLDLADGDVLFKEGDTPDNLYLVLEGSVAISKNDSAGQPQVIAYIHANDFLGEFAMLDGGTRSATVSAAGAGRLAAINRRVILENLRDAGAGLDLTIRIIERIRASNQRQVEERMRQERMSMVGKMINGIIHDFRNPFTVINMLASMLKRKHPDTESYCDMLAEQIGRMMGMAEEVLEFSRGVTALKAKPFAVADLFARFDRLNRDYLQSLNIVLKIDPVCCSYCGDEDKLLRVLQNLVTNAAQALDGKGGEIRINAEHDEGGLGIHVADNGPGIPEQVRHNLFEAFSTYGKQNGLGLGMAITHSIISAHGGTIRFETETGRGTTFHIHLPERAPADSGKAA
jgi:signal transduction histidine kinase